MAQASTTKAAPASEAAPPKPAPAEAPPDVPAFSFNGPDLDNEPETALGLPSAGRRQAAEAEVVEGVDLSGVPRVLLFAGRGKTGKTTAIRWMAERALGERRPLLMGDLDPTNASFSTYFKGVQRPDDADDPAVTLKWLEGFIQHAIRHKLNAVVDLGGGDLNLRRLVDELPGLADTMVAEGVAPVLFYHVGSQVDDLSPVATMEGRGFQPEATAIVMNEATIEPGLGRVQAFARVKRHSVFRDALARGAVPVYMPKLLVADAIEARRLRFLAARDGAAGEDGKATFGAFDRARVRSWLEAMDRQFAGVRTWLP